MNKSQKIFKLIEKVDKLPSDKELMSKEISSLSDDELMRVVMISELTKVSTEHPYMEEAGRRSLMYADKKGYAQLTEKGWEIWDRLIKYYGKSAMTQVEQWWLPTSGGNIL